MAEETCVSRVSSLLSSASSITAHYILSGSFKSTSLFLLQFLPTSRTLSLVQTFAAKGPHQFLASNEARDRVYTTSWALPPVLSSWAVEVNDDSKSSQISHLNDAPITATSSYITLRNGLIYSVGGPTGESHQLVLAEDGRGSFGEKVQEVLFVDAEKLPLEDKTRVGLRYGSHAIEFSKDGKGFVPHLGRNSILMYDRNYDGILTLLDEVESPRKHDGPRHVVPSNDGRYLYSVTEHTSFIDVYHIKDRTFSYITSSSILPPSTNPTHYRGDTLRISLTGDYLFATTRGGKPNVRGYLSVFRISREGEPISKEPVYIWETPSSGGKANAIEVAPFRGDGCSGKNDKKRENNEEWIVLTDDDDGGHGGIYVLEWDGEKIEIVDEVRIKDGTSHAIWVA